jgi:tetratricopeptide (TPR) repeat protein
LTLSLFCRFRFAPSARSSPSICFLFLVIAFASGAASAQEKAQSTSPIPTATVQGRVRDSDGKPVAGATVTLQSTNGVSTENWNTRTDGKGTFRLVGPWAGAYTLHTGESGSSLTIVKSVTLAAGETTKVDLVLDTAIPSATTVQDNSSAGKAPQLFDEPKFTVAGVAPASNSGGHGSDTVLRNSEALVRDTASLAGAGKPAAQNAAGNSAEDGILLQEGSEIQAEIVRQEHAGSDDTAGENGQGDLKLDAPTRQKRSELYHRLAQIDEKLGNPLEAVHEYERAAELAPSEANLFDWGSELLLHRALEPASLVFEKGNQVDPKSSRMLIGLGVAWYARGSYDRAAHYLASASDLAPTGPAPYLFMGKMQSGETVPSAETIERLARFARLAPDNPLANYYYAVGLWKSKRAAGAIDDVAASQIETLLQAAVRLDPKMGAAQLQLGILYAERGGSPRGDNARAVAAYQKAIAVSPELDEAHYRLGLAYKRAGDEAGAQRELQLHEQLAKASAERAEQERGEIQEFVVTLRDKSPKER